MTESSSEAQLAAVRAYASDAMGRPAEAVTAVTPFEDGNRHAVHRVSFRDASDGIRDVVVRVSFGGDASETAQAEREAAVLEHVGGVAAPVLYDFRRTSDWFATPAMCMQFLPGRREDLRTVGLTEIRRLASLVAWVHERPVDGLGEGARTTIASYAGDRLRAILSTLVWARDPLPETLQDRLRSAAGSLAESFAASWDSGETLSLLHGDIAPGNVLWNPGPCLIDWEYTRLGDPADELAYTFDQNALTPSQRRAFWDGYRHGMDSRSRLASIIERVNWWEPVTLLGSALWWVERWVRRTEGNADPGVPREPGYYLGHVISRIDRLDTLVSPP
ncbi:phosphotransferase [Actinoallomurus sp. CA-142502]|uniref:phosphotransferase n=1 Tax=Actinoallomurus sp. CA-142502 TaxID=3239885 RepID=UPI003D8CF3C8